MLQFELYSRNRRPVADFLAKNRKAAKNIKLKTASKVKGSKRESQVATIKPNASQKTGTSTNVDVPPCSNLGNEGGMGDGTVIISKDYLDSLLKRNVMMHPGERGEQDKQMLAKVESQAHYSHHISSIPGLASNTNYFNTNTNTMSANTYQQSDAQPQARSFPEGRTVGGRNKQDRVSSPVTEEYFPFGRPGCGAPLRTASGHVMADLRGGGYNPQHPPTSIYHPHPVSLTQESELLGQISSISGVSTSRTHVPMQPDPPLVQLPVLAEALSPRYIRGAGPHVNQYTLNERAEKRKKELEHKAFLKEQILAKERTKRLAKEKADQKEKEADMKLARERQRQQDDYNRERERAARKEDESRRCQAIVQQAIEKAEEQAICAKMASRAAAAACTSPTPLHISHAHSHEPSYISSNRRGSRIPVHSKYIASNKNSHMTSNTVTALTGRETAQQRQHHQHGVVGTMGQRKEVGRGGTRRRQQAIASRMKACHTMAASSNTTNSSVSLSGDTKCRMRGAGRMEGTISPPVPALARRMKNTGQHQHTMSINTPVHGKTAMNAQQDMPHHRTQVQTHHQDNIAAYNSSHVPTEALSPVHVGRRVLASPPVPALRKKKQKEKTATMIQQGYDDRSRMNMGVAIIQSHTPTCIPPVAKVALIEEKPRSHRQQVILRELAELRKGLMTHCSDVDYKLRTILNDKGIIHF